MRDLDVRQALRSRLSLEHAEDPSTRIVEEMGIWSGTVRIDVAVINGELAGYELKSDRDTLERLPSQAELYSRLFDRMFLVVGSKHEGKARRMIPRWWGVIVATVASNGVQLRPVREAKLNPSKDPFLLAQLLWRDEALEVLGRHGIAKGWRSKPATAVHRKLSEALPICELSDEVRQKLKDRAGWLRQPVGH